MTLLEGVGGGGGAEKDQRSSVKTVDGGSFYDEESSFGVPLEWKKSKPELKPKPIDENHAWGRLVPRLLSWQQRD